MKRDAEYEPQANAFRPADNSPSRKHFTPVSLLFYNEIISSFEDINIIAQNIRLSIILRAYFIKYIEFFCSVW